MGRDKERLSQMPDSVLAREAVQINRTGRRVQLDLEMPGLPESIEVLGETWCRRRGFHVTLIGSGQRLEKCSKEQHSGLSNNGAKTLVNQLIDRALDGKSFTVTPLDELRIARERDRKTIVRMCKVEGAEAFFAELSEGFGFPIEVPPTHITLYTLKNGWPIGIYNRQRLDEVTGKLSNIDAHEVRKLIGLIDTIRGKHYAWGKVARYMSEDAIKQTLEETDGDFVLVDLCSSFPLFPQILRERYKEERCYVQAKKIVGELSCVLQTSPRRMPGDLQGDFNTTSELSDKNRKLRDAIVPRGAPLRRVITSLIEDFLYDPPFIDGDEPEMQIAGRLLNLFKTYRTFYEDVFELEEKIGRGRWKIRIPKEEGITPYSDFTQILGEETDKFITGLSVYFARKILLHARRFTALSLDISYPERLRDESLRSFPKEFSSTKFYRRTNKLEDHVMADIFYLPFQPSSVSFYTCFEGWPFGRFGYNERQVQNMAVWMLTSLKPRGKALFFPWHVQGETREEREQLGVIEKLWQSMGAKVVKKEFTRDELKKQMVDRELVLVDHSPVFQEPNVVFTTCIVEKPW